MTLFPHTLEPDDEIHGRNLRRALPSKTLLYNDTELKNSLQGQQTWIALHWPSTTLDTSSIGMQWKMAKQYDRQSLTGPQQAQSSGQDYHDCMMPEKGNEWLMMMVMMMVAIMMVMMRMMIMMVTMMIMTTMKSDEVLRAENETELQAGLEPR